MAKKGVKKISKKDSDKPLTLGALVDYTHEVLLPAIDERIDGRLVDYTNKILLPALDERFVSKKEFHDFKDKAETKHDEILNKLDILLQEKKVADYQHEKQKQFFLIITKALKDNKILTQSDLKAISKLDIF